MIGVVEYYALRLFVLVIDGFQLRSWRLITENQTFLSVVLSRVQNDVL